MLKKRSLFRCIPTETFTNHEYWVRQTADQAVYLWRCLDGKHEFDYYIAAAITKPVPTGLEKLNVPSATWVVLEQNGELKDLVNRF